MRLFGVFLVIISPVMVAAQTGRISVRVSDFDTGAVITNAEVHAGFNTNIEPGWGWGGGRPNREKGLTGTNGICTLTGTGNGASVGVAAFKDGYYGSAGYSVRFTNVTGTVQKKWQPWNSTVDVVLKPIGDPIAMYAKRVWEEEVPTHNEPVGYDLEAGDWLAPHGQGRNPDVFFSFSVKPESTYTNWYGSSPRVHRLLDYTLTVSFPKQDEGLASVFVDPHQGGSALRLPRAAPDNGYVTNIEKRVYQRQGEPQHSDIRDDQNYFFRVRTVKDEDGNIVSALYGKIHGDFQFDHLGKLTFTYYLNPTPNDRNLEFDPAKNLFNNLSSTEEVQEP